jgi:hypothetical protein
MVMMDNSGAIVEILPQSYELIINKSRIDVSFLYLCMKYAKE